jgi:heat shock protein HslJ
MLTWLGRALVLVTTFAISSGCGSDDDAANVPQGPEPTLVGRTFLSTDVVGYTLAPSTRLSLTFAENDNMSANAGCNTLSSTYRVDDGTLVTGEWGGTEMGCDPERHAQDAWLSTLLASRPTFQQDDDALVITSDTTVITLRDRRVVDPDKPLRDTEWVVDTIVDDQVASSVPSTVHATVRITGDTIEFTNCGTWEAPVAVGVDTLEIGAVRRTAVARCAPNAALDRPLAMTGTVRYRIDASRLELIGPDGKGFGLAAG